ncbi:MAG TPA: endolytic transglycosylase MltG, partial [Ktedonobacteraceae bacterium]
MKQRKSRKGLVSILLLGVLVFAIVYGLWSAISVVFLPANPAAANRTVSITVTPGESTTQIANDLQQKGLIKSALAFRAWARLKGLDTHLQPGVYSKLSPGMSVTQMVDVLQTTRPDAVEVTIIDGWRLEQIAQKLSQAKLPKFKEDDFVRYVQNPDQFPDAAKFPILQSIPPGQSMEGLLFPDTYDISVNATATDVLDKLLQATTDVVNTHNLAGLAQQHQMTLYQVFILASIAEREVRFDTDLPGVASVYWNRVYRPTAETAGYLDADPTVQYARDTDN